MDMAYGHFLKRLREERISRKLTQLQMAVSASKQALQDASSLMNTIRPNF